MPTALQVRILRLSHLLSNNVNIKTKNKNYNSVLCGLVDRCIQLLSLGMKMEVVFRSKPVSPHDVTAHKTTIDNFAAVTTSNHVRPVS